MSFEQGLGRNSYASEMGEKKLDGVARKYNDLGFHLDSSDKVLDLETEVLLAERGATNKKITFYETGPAPDKNNFGTVKAKRFKLQGEAIKVEDKSEEGGQRGPAAFITGQVDRPYTETYQDKAGKKIKDIEYLYTFKDEQTRRVSAVSPITTTVFQGIVHRGTITKYYDLEERPTKLQVTVPSVLRNGRFAEEQTVWSLDEKGQIDKSKKPEIVYIFKDDRTDLPEMEIKE